MSKSPLICSTNWSNSPPNFYIVLIFHLWILAILPEHNNWTFTVITCIQYMHLYDTQFFCFFSIWVFFHERSRFTGQQGKGKGIYLTPLYHFHPLHRHLDISRAIAAESSPLHIAGSRTRTGNLWFPSASR